MRVSKVHYVHSLSYSAKDRLVGTFVLLAIAAVLGLFVFKAKSSKLFDEVVHYHAFMKTAQGISNETLINISGIEVGRVSGITIASDNKIQIDFFVYKDFQNLLRSDSKGELNKLSLVGNALILIKAGNPNFPVLEENSEISIAEPVTTDDLIAGATPVIKNLESLIGNLSKIVNAIDPQVIKQSSENVKNILTNVQQLTEHVNQGQGPLGRVLYDKKYEQSLGNSLLLTEKSLQNISLRVAEIGPVITNVQKLTEQTQQIMTETDKLLHKVDQQLEKVPPLIDDTQDLLHSSQQTVKGVQKIWPLSSKIKPPSKDLLIKEGSLND